LAPASIYIKLLDERGRLLMIENPMTNRGVRIAGEIRGSVRFLCNFGNFLARQVSKVIARQGMTLTVKTGVLLLGCTAALWAGPLLDSARAQPVPPVSSPVAKAKLQNLKVTVLDAQSGKPISEATVTVPAYWGVIVDQGKTNTPNARTDAQGVAELWISPPPYNFSIAVEHPNYSAREARWNQNGRGGPGSLVIPATYTFRLSPAIDIGGYVRNEKGEPIQGVTVLVYGDTSYNYDNGMGRLNAVQEFSSMQRTDNTAVMTDKNGFWLRTGVPPDLDRLRMEVNRPGGARAYYQTAALRAVYGDGAQELSITDLRATNAVLLLRDGVNIRGLVVDSQGKPIAGAQVRERVGRRYGQPFEVITDENGRFELTHRTSAQLVLTATSPEYATASLLVSPAEGMADLRIVLGPIRPLRVRVVNEAGEPVSNAHFRPDEFRSGAQVLAWFGMTDREGRLTWTNAPDQAVAFYVSPPGYQMRQVVLRADGTEKTVRVSKSANAKATIHIRALDAQTQKPVAKYEIWRDEQFNRWSQPWRTNNSANGEFRGELSMSDFRNQGPNASYQLQVRAEGYAPWNTEFFTLSDGDQEFLAKLTNVPAPAGIVLQPDGQPAVGAKVVISSRDQSLYLNNPGDIYVYAGNGTFSEVTDSKGAFRFASAEDQNPIAARHATGFAAARVRDLRASGKIQLQPWGRVEGVLPSATNGIERVSIRWPLNWNSMSDPARLTYSTVIDRKGKFVFTNLPAGDYVLYRQPHIIMNSPTVESHQLRLQLAAGETKKITYAFGGRSVVGHLDSNGDVDWQNDGHVLVAKVGEPPPAAPSYSDFIEAKDFEKARDAYNDSPAVREYERKRQQFQLLCTRDGDFTIDDVPPGTYELQIRLTKPPEDRNMYRGNQPLIGSLIKSVTIPPGPAGSEFDLGTFNVDVNEPDVTPGAPFSFAATSLDGKKIDLLQLRGNPVLVLFWADWAPLSSARLADLRALRTEGKPYSNIKIVTVNLDDDAKSATAAIAQIKESVAIHLEGRSRVDLTEQIGVDALPTSFLLDAQGRVIGHDVHGKRLRSALNRLQTQMARK